MILYFPVINSKRCIFVAPVCKISLTYCIYIDIDEFYVVTYIKMVNLLAYLILAGT